MIMEMAKKERRLACNNRPRMCDGVSVFKENGRYTVYRYIDDWDEEGDTIYAVEEYLVGIPEKDLKREIKATSDSEVVRWIKNHLIKEMSNSLDAIEEFLTVHGVPFSYERR